MYLFVVLSRALLYIYCMKRINFSFILFLTALLLSVCNDYNGFLSDPAPASPPGGGYYGGDGDYGGWGDRGDDGGENGGGQNKPGSGQITCGEWSDIKNYDYYLDLFNTIEDTDAEESQRRNTFNEFIEYFGFETRYMFTVQAVYDGQPLGDAVVELYDSNQDLLFTAKTDARGNAFMFPPYDLTEENITVKAKSGTYETVESFACIQNNMLITLDGRAEKQSVLDLMFVIDTTGSMGDELRYLKSEITDVISTISDSNPNYIINLALLFYRDIGDEYVTRYFDFTTNIAAQQQNLARQSANGGGDFPEAADKALEEAVAKNWNNQHATRLIFHVCDAPPHSDQESQTRYFNAIAEAARKGIRIIPVASSGIDYAAEYLLRQEALMTGGTYIFLTDDSGIGGSHLQPTVGEFTVEYLNDCMVRVVNEYLTGIETDPVPYY